MGNEYSACGLCNVKTKSNNELLIDQKARFSFGDQMSKPGVIEKQPSAFKVTPLVKARESVPLRKKVSW